MSSLHGKICGWGMYVPERIVSNHDIAASIETSDEWIRERTGIGARRVAGPGDNCSSMSVAAAEQALSKARLSAGELELIIVATSSPDYLTPPVSSQVQQLLGAEKAAAFTLVLGCTGFVCALVTAQQFIASGAYKSILIVGAELITRNINWKDRNTCVLFGDGAGAVVMKATSEQVGLMSFVLGSDGSGYDLLIQRSGGTAVPPSSESLAKGLNFLEMNGSEVFKFATRVLGRALEECLNKAAISSNEIDLFIPHQANARIIESAARHVGLPMEKVFLNVERYGNTSAASVPIALCEALDQGRAKEGDTIAMVAFGAGLSWGAAVVKL
ncbi:MAG: 3-oxoacyl-ACP synthase [Proteobacteria bacterium]|nr:MAG: 3-oxoacyl-ACP synthase [Pseudomonadota bacterium]